VLSGRSITHLCAGSAFGAKEESLFDRWVLGSIFRRAHSSRHFYSLCDACAARPGSVSLCTVAVELGELRAELLQRIPRLLTGHDIPGLAIAVVHGPDCWTQGFGHTKRDGGIPVGAETIFSLQSISKFFTAFTVLAAVRDGLVDLDQPVSRYLPECTVWSRHQDRPQDTMTIRHLLCHAAGFTHEAPVGNSFAVGGESFDQHVASISQTWLRFRVGARHEYSNLGLDLAAAIVARVRNAEFADAVRASVLGPLDMTRSTYHLAQIEATSDRAVGHHPQVPQPPVKMPMLGAGGMYSCARDLARFLRAELSGQVLPAMLVTEMRAVQLPVRGQVSGYGLGLGVWAGDGWTVYGGSGGGFGFLADLFWEPASGSGVGVLTNSCHPLVSAFALEILARLAGRDPRDRFAGLPVSRGPASAKEYGTFCGQYVGRGTVLDLTARDGLVGMAAEGESFTPLAVLDDDDLLADMPASPLPLRLRPVAGAGGQPAYLLSLLDGSALGYNSPLPPPTPRDAAQAERHADAHAGDYQVHDLGPASIPAALQLRDQRLWLSAPDLTGVPCLRLDPDLETDGLYFTPTGETLDLRTEPPIYAAVPLHRAMPR